MSDAVHVGDNVGSYVLGALTTEEARDVEAHAAICAQCREEIAELKRVVAILPLTCSSVEPPPDLKSRILSATSKEDEVDAILRRTVAATKRPHVRHDMWHRSPQSWAGVAGWVGVAAACVAAGILIGVADEHHRMETALQGQGTLQAERVSQTQLANAPQPLAGNVAAKTADETYSVNVDQLDPRVAFIGESKVWDLSLGKNGIPCKIIQPQNANHATIVANMPPGEHGMIYRVWLMRKGEMHRGGLVTSGKLTQTTIPMKVHSGDVVAFSMESPNGSAASGPFVYEQTL